MATYKSPNGYINSILDMTDKEDRPFRRLELDISNILTGPTSGYEANRLAKLLMRGMEEEYDKERTIDVAMTMKEMVERFLKQVKDE